MSSVGKALQKGVWFTRKNRSIIEIPIYAPDPGEVLIRNVAVASNPKDWKTALWDGPGFWEGIEGNDVAGYVEAVGSGVTKFNKGDKVAAMTKMNQDSTKWGGYQQYSTALAINTFSLGPKTSLQAAATLPVAVGTAFIGLYKVLGIPLPHSYSPHLLKDPATSHKSTSLVIYGASSSVGSFAVQLAKLSGLFVVGVAGKGADYPRTLGADAVVDYRGKSNTELVKEIELALGDTKLNYVYDAVNNKDTTSICVELLKKNGGRYTYVLHFPKDVERPANIHIEWTNISKCWGAHSEFAESMYDYLGKLLESGEFQGNRVRHIPGGLQGVDEAVEMLKRGEISAEKLVYLIEETPEL